MYHDDPTHFLHLPYETKSKPYTLKFCVDHLCRWEVPSHGSVSFGVDSLIPLLKGGLGDKGVRREKESRRGPFNKQVALEDAHRATERSLPIQKLLFCRFDNF